MKPFKLLTRTQVLFGLLVVVAASWIHVTVHNWKLERSLKVIADAKMFDLNMHFNETPTLVKDFHLIPEVTVAREYLVFGPTHGKVHIFLRTQTSDGVKFGAFDYFFTRNDTQWTETESGYCGDGEIQSEARATFASRVQ